MLAVNVAIMVRTPWLNSLISNQHKSHKLGDLNGLNDFIRECLENGLDALKILPLGFTNPGRINIDKKPIALHRRYEEPRESMRYLAFTDIC